MFLENVKHILRIDDQKVIFYIRKRIQESGYHLQELVISPHKFGIPQQRERVYFVCIRLDVYNSHAPFVLDLKHSEKPVHKESVERFVDSVVPPDVIKKYTISTEIDMVLNAWDELIKQFEEGERMSPTLLVHDAYRDFSKTEWENRPDWKKDYMDKNKRLLDKYRPIIDAWYMKHQTLLQKREIYGKLEWQAGPLGPNDSIYNHFIQIRQSGIRVKRRRFFPTLVAISQIPIYGKAKRYITPRECARLQSFPEDFELHSSDRQSYKQFGNCVNVTNAHDIIFHTLKYYHILPSSPRHQRND
jgi:DNA (cytosine-5)-methyltransferase 1